MPARRLPPLRALEAFMRTVRLGSARAAAEEIGLSPSALSRRISNLEEFVGKKLFTRARQSMQLTDEGQAFYEAVNPHMEALARAVESQSDNIALLRLRLGVLPMFGSQRQPGRARVQQQGHALARQQLPAPLEGRAGLLRCLLRTLLQCAQRLDAREHRLAPRLARGAHAWPGRARVDPARPGRARIDSPATDTIPGA